MKLAKLFVVLVTFFLGVPLEAGPPGWVNMTMKPQPRGRVLVRFQVDRKKVSHVLDGEGPFYLIGEVQVRKKRRLFPDKVKKHYKIERRLKKDEVRGIWLVKVGGKPEKVFEKREDAVSFFLSPVYFRVKRKYFLKRGYKVRGRLTLFSRIPRFPLSRLFYSGKKVDSGWFKIKLSQ